MSFLRFLRTERFAKAFAEPKGASKIRKEAVRELGALFTHKNAQLIEMIESAKENYPWDKFFEYIGTKMGKTQEDYADREYKKVNLRESLEKVANLVAYACEVGDCVDGSKMGALRKAYLEHVGKFEDPEFAKKISAKLRTPFNPAKMSEGAKKRINHKLEAINKKWLALIEGKQNKIEIAEILVKEVDFANYVELSNQLAAVSPQNTHLAFVRERIIEPLYNKLVSIDPATTSLEAYRNAIQDFQYAYAMAGSRLDQPSKEKYEALITQVLFIVSMKNELAKLEKFRATIEKLNASPDTRHLVDETTYHDRLVDFNRFVSDAKKMNFVVHPQGMRQLFAIADSYLQDYERYIKGARTAAVNTVTNADDEEAGLIRTFTFAQTREVGQEIQDTLDDTEETPLARELKVSAEVFADTPQLIANRLAGSDFKEDELKLFREKVADRQWLETNASLFSSEQFSNLLKAAPEATATQMAKYAAEFHDSFQAARKTRAENEERKEEKSKAIATGLLAGKKAIGMIQEAVKIISPILKTDDFDLSTDLRGALEGYILRDRDSLRSMPRALRDFIKTVVKNSPLYKNHKKLLVDRLEMGIRELYNAYRTEITTMDPAIDSNLTAIRTLYYAITGVDRVGDLKGMGLHLSDMAGPLEQVIAVEAERKYAPVEVPRVQGNPVYTRLVTTALGTPGLLDQEIGQLVSYADTDQLRAATSQLYHQREFQRLNAIFEATPEPEKLTLLSTVTFGVRHYLLSQYIQGTVAQTTSLATKQRLSAMALRSFLAEVSAVPVTETPVHSNLPSMLGKKSKELKLEAQRFEEKQAETTKQVAELRSKGLLEEAELKEEGSIQDLMNSFGAGKKAEHLKLLREDVLKKEAQIRQEAAELRARGRDEEAELKEDEIDSLPDPGKLVIYALMNLDVKNVNPDAAMYFGNMLMELLTDPKGILYLRDNEIERLNQKAIELQESKAWVDRNQDRWFGAYPIFRGFVHTFKENVSLFFGKKLDEHEVERFNFATIAVLNLYCSIQELPDKEIYEKVFVNRIIAEDKSKKEGPYITLLKDDVYGAPFANLFFHHMSDSNTLTGLSPEYRKAILKHLTEVSENDVKKLRGLEVSDLEYIPKAGRKNIFKVITKIADKLGFEKLAVLSRDFDKSDWSDLFEHISDPSTNLGLHMLMQPAAVDAMISLDAVQNYLTVELLNSLTAVEISKIDRRAREYVCQSSNFFAECVKQQQILGWEKLTALVSGFKPEAVTTILNKWNPVSAQEITAFSLASKILFHAQPQAVVNNFMAGNRDRSKQAALDIVKEVAKGVWSSEAEHVRLNKLFYEANSGIMETLGFGAEYKLIKDNVQPLVEQVLAVRAGDTITYDSESLAKVDDNTFLQGYIARNWEKMLASPDKNVVKAMLQNHHILEHALKSTKTNLFAADNKATVAEVKETPEGIDRIRKLVDAARTHGVTPSEYYHAILHIREREKVEERSDMVSHRLLVEFDRYFENTADAQLRTFIGNNAERAAIYALIIEKYKSRNTAPDDYESLHANLHHAISTNKSEYRKDAIADAAFHNEYIMRSLLEAKTPEARTVVVHKLSYVSPEQFARDMYAFRKESVQEAYADSVMRYQDYLSKTQAAALMKVAKPVRDRQWSEEHPFLAFFRFTIPSIFGFKSPAQKIKAYQDKYEADGQEMHMPAIDAMRSIVKAKTESGSQVARSLGISTKALATKSEPKKVLQMDCTHRLTSQPEVRNALRTAQPLLQQIFDDIREKLPRLHEAGQLEEHHEELDRHLKEAVTRVMPKIKLKRQGDLFKAENLMMLFESQNEDRNAKDKQVQAHTNYAHEGIRFLVRMQKALELCERACSRNPGDAFTVSIRANNRKMKEALAHLELIPQYRMALAMYRRIEALETKNSMGRLEKWVASYNLKEDLESKMQSTHTLRAMERRREAKPDHYAEQDAKREAHNKKKNTLKGKAVRALFGGFVSRAQENRRKLEGELIYDADRVLFSTKEQCELLLKEFASEGHHYKGIHLRELTQPTSETSPEKLRHYERTVNRTDESDDNRPQQMG